VNYIKKLEAESYDFRKRITLANRVVREFYIYLQSSKFQGVCEDNIATHEVQAYLDRIGGILVDDPWYKEETNETDPT
jgi:hypothetical protein